MRKLLNTLYVTREDVFLALDGENVVVKVESEVIARFPLHTLEGIVSFSYLGASPALIGKCADNGIGFSFCTPQGRFLARCEGRHIGNVLLRREQHRIADDPLRCGSIASAFLFGKVFNAKWVLERGIRDHALRIDTEKLKAASERLQKSLYVLRETIEIDSLRGVEGNAASAYFGVFDQLILRDKETFL